MIGLGVREDDGADIRRLAAEQAEPLLELRPEPREAGVDDRDDARLLDEVPVHLFAPQADDAVCDRTRHDRQG